MKNFMKILEKIKAYFCAISTFLLGVLFLLFRREKEKRVKAEDQAEKLETQVESVSSTAGKIADIKEEKSDLISKVAEVAVSVPPVAKPLEEKDAPSVEPQKVVKGSDFNKLLEDIW